MSSVYEFDFNLLIGHEAFQKTAGNKTLEFEKRSSHQDVLE